MPDPQTIFPAGIPSEESMGVLFEAQDFSPFSILTEEEIGEPRFSVNLPVSSIASAEAIGGPTFEVTIFVDGVPSSESIGDPSISTYEIPEGPTFVRPLRALKTAEKFSGVILNQNEDPPADGAVSLSTYTEGEYQFYQEFRLADDYKRGIDDVHKIPPLTGFQLLVRIDQGYEDVAAVDWTVDRYEVGTGYQTLGSGTAISNPIYGDQIWFSVYFDEPIAILEDWINDLYRIGFQGRTAANIYFKEQVPYEAGTAILPLSNNNTYAYDVILVPGRPHHFLLEGVPSTLFQDAASKRVYLSTEKGLTKVWAVHPNPLATSFTQARYFDNGDDIGTALTINSEEASFNFRVLAGIGDEGTDFLGNRYRNVLVKNESGFVSNLDGETQDKYWLSKPNPSRFAVESLYFDIRDNGEAVSIDRIQIDPLTPGIFANVYWSIEGDPETDNESWDRKLWQRHPQVLDLRRRESHALSLPITAKYIKLEFTHLQARWYAPGDFQKPILYKKHPKWVLDYFLTRIATNRVTEDAIIPRTVRVSQDFLNLAYNYYLDDINQEPATPAELGRSDEATVNEFLRVRNDTSDQVDHETLAAIRRTFFPYIRHPAFNAKSDYLLSTYAITTTSQVSSFDKTIVYDYPQELLNDFQSNSKFVSTLNREPLVIERNMPVMYFFLPTRHLYREVSAMFSNDRAYYAGIKTISFLRDNYIKAFDATQYVETPGDNINSERNDFVLNDLAWTVYDPTP